jgi:iron-sulfur cluster repair protein YtfE (RIC family)
MSDLDFTLMYAAHDAFRRDLGRLTAAAQEGRGADPAVLAGWDVFTRQLDLHHLAEDAALWPQMRDKLAARPDDLALLDEMEAEHANIDPLLDNVDAVLGDSDPVRLREHAANLSAALNHHLDHEESAALPLVAEVLDADGWNALAVDMRRRQGMKGAAVFFPWLLDEAPADRRHHILGLLPPPVRILYRLVWRPRYAPARQWAKPARLASG